MILNRSCNACVCSVFFILLCFSQAYGEFDTQSNRTLEKRLHSIYVNHYTRPLLNSDWFKMLEGIEVQTHRVHAGDTLWSISKVYFGDGHYWSKLWSVNKNITNPHLIYVGDVIHFNSGSFKNAPSIQVEKVSNSVISSSDSDDGANEADDGDFVPSNSSGYLFKPLVKIPDSFIETHVPVNLGEAPITVVPRPALVIKSDFPLTRDILEAPQEIMGKIRSLGKNRIITAEGSIVLINSRTGLVLGEVYTVVKTGLSSLYDGYPVYVSATLKPTQKIDDELFEAQVLQQFSSIAVGDEISSYKVKTVNADISGRVAKEVPIKVISDDKSIWASGDMLFVKAIDKATVSVGDVIKINNKHTDDVEFYVSNGYLKIVSVSHPYAAGVIVSSREDIRKNSVSSPTYTGWPSW